MNARVFKKVAAIALCTALLFVFMFDIGSITASAAEPTTLYVGGVDAKVTPSGSGWSYNSTSGTLTLNDANITGSYNDGGAASYYIYSSGGTLTIVLNGSNRITASGDYDTAIYADGGLTITGSGSLTANLPNSSNAGVIIRGGPFTMSGTGTVRVQSDASTAISGIYGAYCNLIVTDGTLEAVTNAPSTDTKSAINAEDITVSGNGKLHATTTCNADAVICSSLTANFAVGATGYVYAKTSGTTASKKAINAANGANIISGEISPVGASIDTAKEITIESPQPYPGAVGNLKVVGGNGTVTLSWSAPTDAGDSPVTGYNVYNSSNNVKQNSSIITGTTYTISSLTNGTIYSYYVKAVNSYGEGAASATVSTIPDADIPSISISRAENATGAIVVGETLYSSFAGGETPTATYLWEYAYSPDATTWNFFTTSGYNAKNFTIPRGYGGCYVRISAVGTGSYSGQAFSNPLGPIAVAPIKIGFQPKNQYILNTSTSDAKFTVLATTTESAPEKALTYRWVYGNNNDVTSLPGVTGGNTSTLTIAHDYISTHSTKVFICLVSYADGSGESVGTNSVVCGIGAAPEFRNHPSTTPYTKTTTQAVSQLFDISLAPSGYPFTSFVWQYTINPNDAYPTWNDITDIQGTLSSNSPYVSYFTTAKNIPQGLYKFRCVVKNNFGTSTSEPSGLFSVLAPSVAPDVPSSVEDSHYTVASDGITYIRDDMSTEGSSVRFPLDNSLSGYDANTVFKVYPGKYSVELRDVRATYDVATGMLILSSYPDGYLEEGSYFISATNAGEAESVELTRFTIVNKIHIGDIEGGDNNGELYTGYPDMAVVTITFNATESTDFNDGDTWMVTHDSSTGLTLTTSSGTFSGAGGNRTITLTFSITADTPAGDYVFTISSDGYTSYNGIITVDEAHLISDVGLTNNCYIYDGDGRLVVLQNFPFTYYAGVDAVPFNGNLNYQWQESTDSTDGTDGTWADIPYATSAEYTRTAVMSDSGHWFRCKVSTAVVGDQILETLSDAEQVFIRYPVNSNWLMVRNANGDMVRVTDDTVLKPGDVLGFQLNAGYGYNGEMGTESSFSHPGAQEICATGSGYFITSGGHKSYISYDASTSTAVSTYTLTTADIGATVRFYHIFYQNGYFKTSSQYTSYEDEICSPDGTRELHHYSAYSPTVRGDLTSISISNSSRTYPEVRYGDTLVSSIEGNGSLPTATYQWQVYDGRSWSDIPGEIFSNYTVGLSAVGKSVRVIATGSNIYDGTVISTASDIVTSSIIDVTINKQKPAIGDVLSAITIPANATATYEWKANGVTIGTGSTYTVTEYDWPHLITLTITGTGIYSGTATDTTSAVAKPLTGITLSTDTPLTGSAVNTTLLPATATATYKWYIAESASGPFMVIQGATGASYIPNVDDTGLYIKVVATGVGEYAGEVESTPKLVKTAITALEISSDSATTATPLVVAVSPASATVTYQWYCANTNTNSGGTAIAGETSATYMPVTAQINKYIYCVVTGTGNYTGTATSSPSGPVTGVILSVDVSTENPILSTPITASVLPTDASVTWLWCESSSASGPWTEIAGATSNTFTPTQEQVGKFLVAVAVGTGNFIGGQVHILTNAVAAPPTITVHPQDVSIDSGESASFSVTATGTGTFTYVWQASKDLGATWTEISGMTSASLSLSDTTHPHSGELYRCIVSNSAGSVTSDIANLLISDSTSYHWVSGQNGEFIAGNSSGLPFKSDDTNNTATVEELAHVYVDGILLTEGEDYNVSPGSVIITLTPSFLSELPHSTHRLTAEFTDGSTIVTGFTTRSSIPVTDDNNPYGGLLILLMLAAIVSAILVIRKLRNSAISR